MKGTEEFVEGGPSVRTMDIIVAAILMALGAIVMWDSYLIGASWGEFGPQSGYFPFYIGLLIFASSAITLGINVFKFKKGAKSPTFVERSKFKLVLQVLVPSIVFVVLIGFIGLYVAAVLYIAFFMWWLGRYSWPKVAAVSLLVPFALFVLFEIWFLVPLPKGPLEAALGY